MPLALAATAVVLLGATGVAIAASLRLRSLVDLVLAAYLLAFAEVVVLMLVLSPFAAARRPVLLPCLVGICALALVAWVRAGRAVPQIPTLDLLDARPVAVIAVVVALALAYVLALGLGTPPNTIDSLVYHLARAAMWRQEGGARYIDGAYDERLNANPPNAELALGFVLELTRDERFASLVQLVSAVACAVAVFALARRLGLARREALFGGLVFLTLPVVLLQSATTLNDLVVAAPLLAACVFLLGDHRRILGLATLGTALALGTKLTAILALPILCAIALLAVPRAARAPRLAALAAGALVGSYWYLVNLLETGKVLGERQDTGLIAIGELRENVLAGFARVLDAFELPGAEGTSKWVLPGLAHSDALVYVIAAAVLLVLLLLPRPRSRRLHRRAAVAAAALALLPLVVPPASYGLWRVFAKLHDLLGGTGELLPVGEWPPQTVASDTFSWFGPIGLFLVVAICIVGVVGYRRGRLPGVGLLLATAPLLWWALFTLTIGYDPLQGRFFVFPVALSASIWGAALRVPPVAWAVVAVAAGTTLLTLVNALEKPSGLHLFAQRSTVSVWGMPRWEVQAALRADEAPVLRYLEARVPVRARVALMLGVDGLGYPPFGRHLERDVELVGSGDPVQRREVDWLVADSSRAAEVDRSCWRPVLLIPGGSAVFRARARGTCSA